MAEKKVLVIIGRNHKDRSFPAENLGRGALPIGTALSGMTVDLLDNSGYDDDKVTKILGNGYQRAKGISLTTLDRWMTLNEHHYCGVILLGTQDDTALAFARRFARQNRDGKIIHLVGWDEDPMTLTVPVGYTYKEVTTTVPATILAIMRETFGPHTKRTAEPLEASACA